MRVYRLVLCCVLLALAAGSGCVIQIKYDPKKFDPQCAVWHEQFRRGDKSAQVAAKSMGMEAYYEYFMCMEMRVSISPSVENMEYFYCHANDFIQIVYDKLNNPRNWKELYALSCILETLHRFKFYNVGADKDLMNAWREAIFRHNKSNGGFSGPLYLDVVLKPY